MIGIVNYKAGNSHSVMNACEKIGIECRYITKKEDLEKYVLDKKSRFLEFV